MIYQLFIFTCDHCGNTTTTEESTPQMVSYGCVGRVPMIPPDWKMLEYKLLCSRHTITVK